MCVCICVCVKCLCLYLCLYVYVCIRCDYLLHDQEAAAVNMGWLRLVGSLKLQVSFAEYRFFNRALLQKRPIILRSLLIVATPYGFCLLAYCKMCVCLCVSMSRACVCFRVCVCVCVCICVSDATLNCLLRDQSVAGIDLDLIN